MKKNKRNKILTLLSALTLFTFTIGGVKAEELNAATCKDREKYTYYFYFANAHDAIAIQNDLTYNKYE